ncbi:hypothetical protein [Crassaminicella profunda]|uniref:hypothetical protein n=1 Tax=Crassaminicella profunda TaxID=1286698 RepID=UPI001CA719CD|nr:hypothetical protein [Crassaminicella profunda]QZY56651.1 hypothetical protein K7H06_06950 [Crassaminicella profunda]
MKIKMIKGIYSIVPIIIVFIASYFLVHNNLYTIIDTNILEDTFVLNFIGIFFGFAITSLALIYSSYEKIANTIVDAVQQNDEDSNYEEDIFELLNELKEDVIAIFYCILIAFILILLRNIDIPIVKFPMKIISKDELILISKLSFVLLTLYAMYDLTQTIFDLIKISYQLSKRNKEKKSS